MSYNYLNDYFSDFITDSPIKSNTFQSENIENIENEYSSHGIVGNRIRRETIFEVKLRNNLKNLKPNKYLLSNEDISNYRDSFI